MSDFRFGLRVALCLTLIASATVSQDDDEEEDWTESPMDVAEKRPQTNPGAFKSLMDVRCVVNFLMEKEYVHDHQLDTKRCCDEQHLECTLKKSGDQDDNPQFEDSRCHAKTKEQVGKLQKCCTVRPRGFNKTSQTYPPLKPNETKSRLIC